jgi:hypothetical protein
MAELIGGTEPYPGKNNHIVGTDDGDLIFGDPYTTGTTVFFYGGKACCWKARCSRSAR